MFHFIFQGKELAQWLCKNSDFIDYILEILPAQYNAFKWNKMIEIVANYKDLYWVAVIQFLFFSFSVLSENTMDLLRRPYR